MAGGQCACANLQNFLITALFWKIWQRFSYLTTNKFNLACSVQLYNCILSPCNILGSYKKWNVIYGFRISIYMAVIIYSSSLIVQMLCVLCVTYILNYISCIFRYLFHVDKMHIFYKLRFRHFEYCTICKQRLYWAFWRERARWGRGLCPCTCPSSYYLVLE